MRSKSLFELAAVPPLHSESLFEPAVQDHYSKVLVSVALCSESLYSALLCYVHGYARVHTSIYIYTQYLCKCSRQGLARAFRRFLSFRSRWLKRAQKSARRRKRAQKGARKRCSSLPGTASALEEAVRACFGAACAFEEAVRDCCSRSLFESAGLGYTVL